MNLPRPNISTTTLLFVVALILGLGVAWLVMHTLHRREAQMEASLRAKQHANDVAVVVPTRNLKPGEVADSSTMAQRSVPRNLLPPNTVTAANWPEYDGRTLSHHVYRGIPMQANDFGAVVQHSQFLSLLQPGQLAITTDVSTDNSIAGLLQPGNKVDILLLLHRRHTIEEVPVFHQVTVLATGQNFGRGQPAGANDGTGNSFGNITLAMTPKQTALLTLAEQAGSLRVALASSRQPAVPDPLHSMLEAALFYPGGHTGKRHWTPRVQYIIGRPGENKTLSLPLAASISPPLGSVETRSKAAAAVKGIAASTAQTLAKLQTLLKQSPVSAAASNH